jgi:hypothetical protein
MVGPIESVTVAVSDLERCRRLFEEQLGLTTAGPASDGLASVAVHGCDSRASALETRLAEEFCSWA